MFIDDMVAKAMKGGVSQALSVSPGVVQRLTVSRLRFVKLTDVLTPYAVQHPYVTPYVSYGLGAKHQRAKPHQPHPFVSGLVHKGHILKYRVLHSLWDACLHLALACLQALHPS